MGEWSYDPTSRHYKELISERLRKTAKAASWDKKLCRRKVELGIQKYENWTEVTGPLGSLHFNLYYTILTTCMLLVLCYGDMKYNLHIFFPWRYSPNLDLGLPPWNSPFHFSFLDLRQSVGLLGRVISSPQVLYLYTNTEKRTHTQTLNIHALGEIRTHNPGFRASEDIPLGYRDRQSSNYRREMWVYCISDFLKSCSSVKFGMPRDIGTYLSFYYN
jgi:hypothetical protein